MKTSKFKSEVETLKKFFELYCKNHHKNIVKKIVPLKYEKEEFYIDLNLCEDCYNHINYCFCRLLDCPHDEKPRCRKCPNPCYERKEWKNTAKIMRYSGIRLGLTSVKKKFLNLKNE